MIDERRAHKFCRDDISKIENYDKAIADTTQTWHLHHRLELTLDDEFALSLDQLKMHDMYYHRPYYELIFLTPTEHIRIHRKGKHLSDESKRKLSEANKGENHPNYGKHLSEETRKKMSESLKGVKRGPMSKEQRRKISESLKGVQRGPMSEVHRRKLSESKKGKHKGKVPWNKGKTLSEETRRKLSESHKGHHYSEESRRKMSEAAKNRANITEETRRKQSESHKGLRWKLMNGNRVWYRNEEDTSLG